MQEYWRLINKMLVVRNQLDLLVKGFYTKYNLWPNTLFLNEKQFDNLEAVWRPSFEGHKSPKESNMVSFFYVDLPATVSLKIIVLEVTEPIVGLIA